MPLEDFYRIANDLELQVCDVVFSQVFNSYDDLKKYCVEYFAKNNIEGIVVKDETGKFSAKLMNDAYDAKK